jgi:hypothetical protein
VVVLPTPRFWLAIETIIRECRAARRGRGGGA